MPCFCDIPTQSFLDLTPNISFALPPVPIPMINLNAMMKLDAPWEAGRLDANIAAAFDMGGYGLPSIGFNASLNLGMQLAIVANIFPLSPLDLIIPEIQRALDSLKEQMGPAMGAVYGIPKLPMANLALAARMTLALRAQGIDPMELAAEGKIEDTSNERFSWALSSASMFNFRPPIPFALTIPQVELAHQMAALADLSNSGEALGLPGINTPDFAGLFYNMLMGLAAIPLPNIDLSALLALATKLEDLAVINEAFGEITPGRMGQINAMFGFMSSIPLPMPDMSLALAQKIEGLPPVEKVNDGLAIARSMGPNFSSAFSMPLPSIPVLPVLQLLAGLGAMLYNNLGMEPNLVCTGCKFPLAS